jgi:hypothetical protein
VNNNRPLHDIASNSSYEKRRGRVSSIFNDWREKFAIEAVSLTMRAGLAVAYAVSGLSALIFAPATFAAERLPNGARGWMALDTCAAYGPGFTSVENSTACVRIGGHVRVEIGSRSYYQYTRQTAATTAVIRTENLSASDLQEPRHLRVGTDDPYDPFR